MKKSPKQVVILTDKRVGSAAESFVMKVKQSKKLKVLGTVTSGGLDYAAARIFDFGRPEFCCNYLPIVRRDCQTIRLNIGMQPDIYLDKSTGDLVKFASDYLEHES